MEPARGGRLLQEAAVLIDVEDDHQIVRVVLLNCPEKLKKETPVSFVHEACVVKHEYDHCAHLETLLGQLLLRALQGVEQREHD